MSDLQEDFEVRLGDKIYRLEPFRGSKGIRVLRAVSRIGKAAKPVTEEWLAYDRTYRESNQLIITRETCEMRIAQSPSDEIRESWERVLEGPLRERDFVAIPQNPSLEHKIMKFFPDFYEVAEEDVLRLLALILISNNDLKVARQGDRVESTLNDLSELMLEELELPLLVEILVRGIELVQGQFQETREIVGKLRNFLASPPASTSQEAESESQRDDRQTTRTVGSVILEEPNATSDPSSTDSPPPTGGPPSEPSSASSGAISTPSAT